MSSIGITEIFLTRLLPKRLINYEQNKSAQRKHTKEVYIMTVISVPPAAGQGSSDVRDIGELLKLLDNRLDEWGPHKIRGYVTNLTRRENSPSFFNLSDNGNNTASVLVPSHVARWYTKTKESDLVEVTGKYRLRKGKDQLQFIAKSIKPLGLSLSKPPWHNEIKNLARSQRSLVLEAIPNLVTVVGPEGDGLHDITSILKDKQVPINLDHIDIKSCPDGIVKGINQAICDGAELIILARGGGSNITWPYNDEKVVRAVATSSVPVITAIGHADDHTKTDEVAKKSLKTPTDAAHFIVDLFDGKIDLDSLKPHYSSQVVIPNKSAVQERTQGEVSLTSNTAIQDNEAVHISAALSNMDVTNTPKSYLGRKMRRIFSWIRSLRFGSKTVCPMSRDGDS